MALVEAKTWLDELRNDADTKTSLMTAADIATIRGITAAVNNDEWSSADLTEFTAALDVTVKTVAAGCSCRCSEALYVLATGVTKTASTSRGVDTSNLPGLPMSLRNRVCGALILANAAGPALREFQQNRARRHCGDTDDDEGSERSEVLTCDSGGPAQRAADGRPAHSSDDESFMSRGNSCDFE